MNRRQILKSILFAPFAGLVKLKERKELNIKIRIGETITVPESQTWVVHKIVVNSPTMGDIATTTNTDHTYILSGYIIQ